MVDSPNEVPSVSSDISDLLSDQEYGSVLSDVVTLMEAARRVAARSVNALMTASYWEIGRRIVELEQRGEARAEYGKRIIERSAVDLSNRLGRGFQKSNLFQMRAFYLAYPHRRFEFRLESNCSEIFQTVSEQFPLPWSHYVKLLSIKSLEARAFYEQEALRSGWSVRQLTRQINIQYYERALLSKNKAAMLEKESLGMKRRSLLKTKSRIPLSWNFLISKTNTLKPTLKMR